LEKNPLIPSSSNKVQALKKKNKSINMLKRKKKLEIDSKANLQKSSSNQQLNADVQNIDFNFTTLTSEQQKHCKTTPSKSKKEKLIIGLKRSYSSMSDRKQESENDNIPPNTPSKLPRLKSLSERKKMRYEEELIENEPIKGFENTPSKFGGLHDDINMKGESDDEKPETPSKNNRTKLLKHNYSTSSSDSSASNNADHEIDKKNKFATPKKQRNLQNENSVNVETNSITKHSSIMTPSKMNKFKKVETTPHKATENKNENSKLLSSKSSAKKKKNSSVIPSSPSLATPYMFKQNLIKKFKEVDNPKIRIEALKELLEYFKASRTNKLGTSLQINEGIMSFLNDTSDEILGEILEEQTLDILLKTRVISIEQLIPKIIDVEIKINKQNESSNQNENSTQPNHGNTIYSEFAINKVNNVINWIKQEKFTVPIMKNIIVELIAKNGKSRKKYNNVNEILECLLEWVIELLINDMSENIFYMNNKSNKELEIDYKIGKRNPCIYFKNEANLKSMIHLLGKWISTTFGNEINGRSLISFLWCIKKLNNKTLKYIKECFSEEIYDQLIKGIEILDNEFEKSKETILCDNNVPEQEDVNENKENYQMNDNVQNQEANNISKENSNKNSFMDDNITQNEKNENIEEVNNEKLNRDNNLMNQLEQKPNENNVKDSELINLASDNVKSNVSMNKNEFDNALKNNSISYKNEVLVDEIEKNIEKSKNTLIKDLMEIDEKYDMLPEETFSSNIPNNKSLVIDKSFVTHRNVKLSGIIELNKSFISVSDKKETMESGNPNNNINTEKLKDEVIIEGATDLKEMDNEINKNNIKEVQESEVVNDRNEHIDPINNEMDKSEKKNEKLNNNIINDNNKDHLNKKMDRVDSKIDIHNDVDKKEIKDELVENHENQKMEKESIENNEKVKIKEESIEEHVKVVKKEISEQKFIKVDIKKEENSEYRSRPYKKAKINHDKSQSVILIENSDLIFEKENPRRKLRTHSKENDSIIILDDTKSNIKLDKNKKEDDVICIDDGYNSNKNKKVIKKKTKSTVDERIVINIDDDNETNVIISDNDQDTPKNDFETNVDDNKENIDDNANDNTMSMNIPTKDNQMMPTEKLDNNINIGNN